MKNLTPEDTKVIGECLFAASQGPFIPDWEFHTLTSLTKEEMLAVAKAWPNVDYANEAVRLAVNNSVINLWGYPIYSPERWKEFISVSREELKDLLDRYRLGLA